MKAGLIWLLGHGREGRRVGPEEDRPAGPDGCEAKEKDLPI